MTDARGTLDEPTIDTVPDTTCVSGARIMPETPLIAAFPVALCASGASVMFDDPETATVPVADCVTPSNDAVCCPIIPVPPADAK